MLYIIPEASMDQIDIQILDLLKINGRATASEISKSVSLSIPAVSERIKKLEDSRIIEYYTIKINRPETGLYLLAMIFINLEKTEQIDHFRKTIVSYPEVLECHHMAGEYDYLAKVLVADTTELEQFLSQKLKTIEGVLKTNTLIILSTLKESINRQENHP
jgi:Lrp/AsnC family leucine-responsive transcriptional regulator